VRVAKKYKIHLRYFNRLW